MLYREIIDVCFEIHKKHIYALCGQNVEFLCTSAKLQKTTERFIMCVCVCVCARAHVCLFVRVE